MAVSVATTREDEVHGSHKLNTQPATYRSVERNGLRTRIRALVGFWENVNLAKSHVSDKTHGVVPRDLFRPYGPAMPNAAALPTYEESVLDVPPDYTLTDAFANAHTFHDSNISVTTKADIVQDRKQEACEILGSLEKLDFSNSEHIKTHASKKAKKAAKAAQMSKWADSDNEEKKEGEDGTAGDDNTGGGGGSGGSGGDPPGGDDGEWGDEWGEPSGKKNKKKKKNLEDEEKKQEEEDKKAEEEAAVGTGDTPPEDEWSSFPKKGKKGKKGRAEQQPEPEPEPVVEVPVIDTGADDDWAGFTTGKKKKKKKGELEPEPEPEVEAVVEVPVADAGADDDWSAFTTAKSSKKENKKKGKNDPAPADPPKDDMKFDDINLNDDKAAPKLDLDFGLGKKAEPAAEKSSGFSFGGWGSGWRSSAAASWGFGGSASPAEPKQEEEPSGWGFTSTLSKKEKDKDKDKKKSSAFDFNFDNIGGDTVADTLDLGAPAAEEELKADEDPWGGFTSAKDKKKAKKKGAIVEPEPMVEVPPPPEEPPAAEEDLWGGFMSTKERKKAAKKKGMTAEPQSIVEAPPPPPAPEEQPAEEDPWGGFMSAKDKKKAKKKGLLAEPEPVVEEPAPPPPAPEEPPAEEDPWGGFMSAKDKKKAKKKGLLAEPEPVVEEPAPPPPAPEEPPAEEDPWGGFMSAKDKKKAKKKGLLAEPEPVVEEPAPPPPAIEEPPADDPWSSIGTKKDKKKKKSASMWDLPEPEVEPDSTVVPKPEPEVVNEKEDDLFAGFGLSAKDKKKAKKAGKNAVGELPVEEPPPPPKAEPAPAVVDSFDGWGKTTSKKDKKTKKGTFDWSEEPAEPVVAVPPPQVVEPEATTDWLEGGWADTSSKSKKKSKKAAIEEVSPPPPPPPPEPVAETGGEDWFSGFGTKKADKKSKKGKADIWEPAAPEPSPADDAFLMPEAVVEPKAEGENDWANSWSTGTKKKASKKDKSKGITEVTDPSPGASVLLPESVQEKSAEDDPWASWTTGKKAKVKGTKKLSASDVPPVAPPQLALEDVPADTADGTDLLDMSAPPADDFWGFGTSTKKKAKADKKGSKITEAPKVEELTLSKTKSKDSKRSAIDDILDAVEEAEPEDAPVSLEEDKKKEEKASSSGWGLFGSSSKSKSSKKETPKEQKEREKREKKEREAAEEAQRKADEEAFAAALGEEPNDILDLDEEPAPPPKKSSKDKDSKKKGTDKLSKVDSKSSKKSEPKDDPNATIVDAPEPDPILDFEEPKKADGWGFWGSSLKSTMNATPATATKSKIGSDPWANQDAASNGMPNMPDVSFGNDGLTSAMSPPKATVSSKTKAGTKTSSIQDRIKALQGDTTDTKPSKSKNRASAAPPEDLLPEPEPEPEPVFEVPVAAAVPEKKPKKSASSKKDNKKDLSAAEPVVPHPVSPVPGEFPVDDILEFEQEPEMVSSPPKKSSSKDKKGSSKSTKNSKSKTPEPLVVEAPPPTDLDDLLGPGDEDLPTPPPEAEVKDKSKSSKKERPKVVRDNGTSSWGFWGATPAKKPAKKDGATTPPRERPAGLSRSKSARKPSDKDPLEKLSKSSGSEKDGKQGSKSRPSTSRGMSFSMFGMGAPPARSKSARQSTKPSSRRHSTAVEDNGLMSPPPEENEMSAKAAKVMGVNRSKSTREKSSRKVPDPYAIDSDDLVMVDAPEDSAKDMAEPKQRKKSSKSRREPAHMSGGLGGADEDFMPDAARHSEEAKVFSGPDDLAFVERPTPVRRTTSSAKKTSGLMGGILGAFSARPTPDRRQSKVYESEDSRRKRASAYDDEHAKRLRREGRKVNRNRMPSGGNGHADPAPMTDVEDAEAKETRRRERRERRDREAAEEEARSARRREKEESRRIRAREEEDQREAERRRARRAEKEARRAEDARLAREEEQAREERRERRREKERQRAEDEAAAASRPKTDRRRSYVDAPEDDEARRLRREERRMRRSVDPGADKERPRPLRRRSDYPRVDGYFDKRNGEHSPGIVPSPIAHAIKTGGDKTASWVHSVNEDRPPPPPVEGTIIDAPVHYAEDDAPDALDDTTAREYRNRRRREQGEYVDEDSERRRRRRGDVPSGSGGSSHGRNKSYGGPSNSLGYDDMGVKTWDGRPANNRRQSWFKKIAGF